MSSTTEPAARKSRFEKLAALTAEEWILLLRALMLLPWTAFQLRSRGYVATLEVCSPSKRDILYESGPEAFLQAKKIARMVDIAAQYGPYRAKCLCRSMTLLRLMRRQGLPGDLVLGAQWDAEGFGAHAWVNMDNKAVNESTDKTNRFVRFGSDDGAEN